MSMITSSPLALAVYLHVSLSLLTARASARAAHLRDEGGQTSAEYALVLLGAATVALLITAWAAKTGKLGLLLDTIFDKVTGKVT